MWDESAWQAVIDQSDSFEFDWYGVDRLSHVAAFSSYGHGVISSVVKTGREAYNALDDMIAALPDFTQAKLLYKGNGRYDPTITKRLATVQPARRCCISTRMWAASISLPR